MVVTIRAFHTITPTEPTPQGCLWLSDMDQVVRLRHTPTVYIYKTKDHNDDTIERLKNSLSKILVHYYPMAGRLCWTQGGRLELQLNAKGAVILEAESSKTMGDYGDFSPSETTQELVPLIDYDKPIEEIPLFIVQLTRFQNNEGFALGVAFFHPLADGLAAIHFINSWAKIARGETLEPNEIPFLDRTLLKFSNPPKEPRFHLMELKPLPLILGRSDTTEEKNKKTAACLLRLSAEQVEKLKKKANENDILSMGKLLQDSNSRPYSRYETISAHIWRCVSKARELDEMQPTVVRFNADIRSRIIPPLPINYFGNALAMTSVRCFVGEITSKPLGYVAQKIREATKLVTDEYIRSQIDVIRGYEKDLDNARALFFGGGEGKNATFFGNPNFHLTSWMSMPVYEADFGWGKPVYFGLAYVCAYDKAFILLSPNGDGSVIVCFHFQTPHMDLFQKFFYQDI